jgi:RHS repeat-associated protein
VKTLFRAIAFFILCSATMFGQAPPSVVPQGVPYENHGMYSINLQDMSLVFNIPIHSKPGFHASFIGAANRLGQEINGPGYLAPIELNQNYTNDAGGPSGGSYANGIVVNGMVGPAATVYYGSQSRDSCGQYLTHWYVEDASGSVHPVPPGDEIYVGPGGTSCPGNPTTFTAVTLDSQYTLQVTTVWHGSSTAQVWANDGSTSGVISWGTPILSWQDSHGNAATANNTFTSWTDPMAGIAPLTSTGVSTSPSYSWTDINGGTQTVAFTGTPTTIKTTYGCTTQNVDQAPYATDLITKVAFPDGSSLGISYEPNGSGYTTGRISELTLPTGGTVTFAYSGFNCAYAEPTEMTMTTSEGTWTYAWAPVTYGSGLSETYGNTVTVTDPAGNRTIHSYIGLGLSNSTTATFSVFETQTQQFYASNVVTIARCYNGATACLSTAPTTPISSVVSTTTLPGLSTSQKQSTTFDVYGDVLTDTRYDFSGTLYNETMNTYNVTALCGAASIIPSALCSSEQLYTGNEVSKQTYTRNSQGGALSINSWLSGNAGITITNTFNANGTLKTSLSPTGVTITNTYGDCNGFGLTKTAISSTLYTSYTYGSAGCDGGVPVSKTDSNGNVTNLYYSAGAGADPYYRQLIAEDPQGNYHYHEYSPTNTVSYLQGSGWIVNLSQEKDAYGRPSNLQKETGPSLTTYDTFSTSYAYSTTSGLGGIVTNYAPCEAAKDVTCEATARVTTQYDGLGRPATKTTALGGVTTYTYGGNDAKAVTTPAPSGENTKGAISESNGLWTTIVCPIVTSTLPAGTSCGTANLTGTGYPTIAAYSVSGGIQTTTQTRGSQVHTKTLDSLGRTVTESYPEPGTVHYYYDAQSPHGCPTANGLLTEKDDAKGNEICYTYDAYARVTKIATNGTLCRLLYYDTTTRTVPSGVTITNPYGHMVEAATTNCGSTLLTDEWMSYDSLNRVGNSWESTPHSGGYYHAAETYFANGVVNVEALGTALSTTYAVDGEGRWTSAQIGAANTVTSVAYNAEQQPTAVVFPTGEVSTTTTEAIAPHQTTFTVASVANISVNQNLMVDVVGAPGTLPEEIQVASISGLTITIGGGGAFQFHHDHASGVPVTSTSNDEDTYSYNTSGMMSAFEFVSNESGGVLQGSLGYNANGTVNSLELTDTVNSGASQTCSYLYDDLARLNKDNCIFGSTVVYNSTMAHDSYDNITKSTSNGTGPTWPVSGTYSATNNQLSSSTYDGNGSTLTDYFHTYTWDGFNKMLTMDGNTMTYDAFGRIVEVAAGGAYTQHWYSPVGTVVLMNGSTMVKAHLPMPGRLAADWTPAGTYINHKDFIGTTRWTTQAGAVYSDQALGPYGENTAQQYGASTESNYTSMTSDIETNVFDTPAREYMPSQSRWPNVDPAHASWNGYAYVSNPLQASDSSGLDEDDSDFTPQYTDDSTDEVELSQPQQQSSPTALPPDSGTDMSAPDAPSFTPNGLANISCGIQCLFGNGQSGNTIRVEAHLVFNYTFWPLPGNLTPGMSMEGGLVSPDFYQASVSLPVLGSIGGTASLSYVPSTYQWIYGMGGSYGAGFSVTGGYMLRGKASDYLLGASGSVGYFFMFGTQGGSTPDGSAIASQYGVGMGGFGTAIGTGAEVVNPLMQAYENTPADPFATVYVDGLGFEDPSVTF